MHHEEHEDHEIYKTIRLMPFFMNRTLKFINKPIFVNSLDGICSNEDEPQKLFLIEAKIIMPKPIKVVEKWIIE